MKKHFLLLGLALCAHASSAQLTGGIKAGINVAQLFAEAQGESETTDMVVGFQLGGYLNHSFSEKIVFQPELIFSRVGGKDSEYDPDLQDEIGVQFKFDYLAIPLNIKFKINDNFGILAGPQVGYLAGAKTKIDLFGTSVTVDVKDQFKALDLGANLGLSYTINKIGIDLRYFLGFSNIADIDDPDVSDATIKNRTFSLTVNYQLFEK